MISLPFNHQPESVSVQTGSYTIPVGKYARITVSLDTIATGSLDSSSGESSYSNAGVSSTSDSKCATFFVNSGSVLDVAVGSLNVSSSAVNASDETAAVKGSIESSFSINSVKALVCKSTASANTRISGGTTETVRVDGSADARYIVELYNELT